MMQFCFFLHSPLQSLWKAVLPFYIGADSVFIWIAPSITTFPILGLKPVPNSFSPHTIPRSEAGLEMHHKSLNAPWWMLWLSAIYNLIFWLEAYSPNCSLHYDIPIFCGLKPFTNLHPYSQLLALGQSWIFYQSCCPAEIYTDFRQVLATPVYKNTLYVE